LTRGDMLVLLSRADDFVNKPSIDEKLIAVVVEKRISDIKKATDTKKEEIAKGFIKGFLRGSFNGWSIQNRNLKLTNRVTKTGALSCIKMSNDQSLRAKLSPDGKLIRTTNLPKNASSYEYILECYPNKFYEKKFEFMITENWKTRRDPDSYAYPVEMKTENFKNWYDEWPLIEEMDKHLYEWSAMAEEYLQYVFNVDYRTVDDKWINGLGSLYAKSNVDYSKHMRTFYIGNMKENKVVVESSIIAVEPSSFYEDDSDYCIRAYVRYRITAQDISVKQSKLIYTQYPSLNNLKNGKWIEGIFDIRFDTNNGSSGDGSDFAISFTSWFVDDFNVPVE
ncbi:MAG: hypothetical protein K0R46_3078, partial [Herbinix sp.]|nr:hypothetical protein [Herbinix sp.]